MSDTKFHIRYEVASGMPGETTYTVVQDWTEDYGAAADFRNRLDILTGSMALRRDALGNPDADGCWRNPVTGLRLSWWIQ